MFPTISSFYFGYHEVVHEVCRPRGRRRRRIGIPIKLPAVELEHLRGAPLQFAIAQVRFAPVYAIEHRTAIAGFQERLGHRYLARESAPPKYAVLAGPATPQIPPVERETVWRFQRAEDDWTISLSSTSLALEATRYLDFDDFARELSMIVKALHGEFEPQREVRLGLRYVNRIEDPRLKKRGVNHFVNEQLAGPVGGVLGNDLLGSFAELRFHERSGTLAIRHGLIEPARYLLDFDRFADEEREFAPASIVQRIKRFHDLIERLFVWSLNPRYLKELKGGGR